MALGHPAGTQTHRQREDDDKGFGDDANGGGNCVDCDFICDFEAGNRKYSDNKHNCDTKQNIGQLGKLALEGRASLNATIKKSINRTTGVNRCRLTTRR